ncbi:MAG TPA: SCO family protein [Gemmataceae bacterium]|nr:SCO family protein [Gemmataceae bacterium]
MTPSPARSAGDGPAPESLPPLVRGVRFEQRLNESVPLDLTFLEETGEQVRLTDYFAGKPVILVLAYYRCPRLCTQVLNGLLESLKNLQELEAGKEFQVVAVSFDPRESSELAAAKKKAYVENYGRPSAGAGWHFLTGPQQSIDRLTEAVGFHYAYDPASDQFAHASGIVVLTPQRKIARYFYGIQFPPRDLRLGLVEAAENKIGSPVDQLLLLCFHYDPATGKYTVTALNFVRLAGGIFVLALGLFFVVLWRREKRQAPTPLAPAG